MKTPYGEIIRGEVSIFRGGAGGLSYFSSGSFRGTLCVGASWAETVASEAIEARQMNRAVAEGVEDPISGCVGSLLKGQPSMRFGNASLQSRLASAARIHLCRIAVLSRII